MFFDQYKNANRSHSLWWKLLLHKAVLKRRQRNHKKIPERQLVFERHVGCLFRLPQVEITNSMWCWTPNHKGDQFYLCQDSNCPPVEQGNVGTVSLLKMSQLKASLNTETAISNANG